MAKRDSAPDARAAGEGVAAVYLPLASLRPNPRNPRLHGAEVERIGNSVPPLLMRSVAAHVRALVS